MCRMTKVKCIQNLIQRTIEQIKLCFNPQEEKVVSSKTGDTNFNSIYSFPDDVLYIKPDALSK